MHTGDGDGLVRERVWIGGLDEDGRATRVIMEYRGSETIVLGGGTQSANAPFLRSSVVALAGDEIVRAFTANYALEFYDLEGTLIRVVRRPVDLEPVTQSDIDAFTERFLQNLQRIGRPDLVTAMVFPETHPAFEGIVVARDGHLWVEAYQSQGTRWSVFDPSGEWATNVDTPERFRIGEIGSDYILGTTRDTMGVEFVKMYRIMKDRT